MPPSRQLCERSVVMAWGNVREELLKHSWIYCGYTSMEDLQNAPSCMYDWSASLGNDAQFLWNLNVNDSYHFSNK